MRRFLGIVFFMALATLAQAVVKDSIGVTRFYLPTDNIGESVVKGTQSAMLYAYNRSFTQIALTTKYRDESRALIPQLGSGETKGVFSADSYIRLNKKTALWGNVEYFNGAVKSVRWNSTSDYLQLYPYIMADSVGGNLSTEQYLFSGGYAGESGRFTFGIMGRYRALHEYRTTDPRPRGVVSDFNVAVSGGICIGDYLIGLNIGGRIYKQFLNIAFYNESGANTSELHFTGIGSHYERFGGAGDYTSARYKGGEYSATVSVTPRNYMGWYANAGYGIFGVKYYLPNQNMVQLTYLKVARLFGNVAYKKLHGAAEWGVEASAVYEKRTGTENIIDNGAGNVHEILGSLKMYENEKITAKIRGKAIFNGKNGRVWVELGAGYRNVKSEYLFPGKELRFAMVVPHAEAGYMRHFNLYSCEFAMRVAYSTNIEGNIDIPEQHTDARIRASFIGLYDRLTDSCIAIEPKVRIQREIASNRVVYLMVRYGRFIYGCNEWANMLTASFGVCF